MHLKQAKIDAVSSALDSAHSVAFHTGLGSALYPSSTTPLGPYMNEHTIASYAEAVYNKGNIALVADGAAQSQLSKWGETFFKAIPSTSSSDLSLNTAATKYFGGESRTSRPGANAYVIAFPGASLSDNKPEISVLTALLGGVGNVKWTTGFSLLSKAAAASPGVSASAHNHAYSDAGLLTISISGPSGGVKKTAEEAVKAIKSIADGSVSKEDVSKAIANAKFNLLSVSETSGTGIVATGAQLIAGGKPLDVAAAVKNLESVTADKLKAVSTSMSCSRMFNGKANNNVRRRRSLCWRARPVLRLLVICTCCPMRRIWVSRYRAGSDKWVGKTKCTNSVGRCRVSASPCAYSDLVRLAPVPHIITLYFLAT